jgi:CRP/FNR family transcriptional regulator, anaerobic regulatory protein
MVAQLSSTVAKPARTTSCPNTAGIPDSGLLRSGMSKGITRLVDAGEPVFHEGDPTTHIYNVESGSVSVFRMMPDGRRQILQFALPGDNLGLGEGARHAASAEAASASRIRCVPSAVLRDILRRDPRSGLDVLNAMSNELVAAQDRILTLGRRTALERMAVFLLSLSRRNQRLGDDPDIIVLPMTRCDIADYLGLTTETVSRTVTLLKKHGVIRLLPDARVRLVNCDLLEELSEGECELPGSPSPSGVVRRDKRAIARPHHSTHSPSWAGAGND